MVPQTRIGIVFDTKQNLASLYKTKLKNPLSDVDLGRVEACRLWFRLFRLFRRMRLQLAGGRISWEVNFWEDSMSAVDDRLESKEEVELAKAAQRCIVSALDHSRAVNIAIVEDGVESLGDSPLLKLPPKVLRLFADMLGALAQGKAVAVLPKELDLTTQEAAMFLNISRPYFVRLLEDGKIPFHKVGTHRRVKFEDIVKYKDARRETSRAALQALADEAQELGMGY